MTEKFMKLTDFLKLIKKEDENESPSEAEKKASDISVSRLERIFDENEAVVPEDRPADPQPERDSAPKTASKKKSISDEELSSILSYFGWKLQPRPVIPRTYPLIEPKTAKKEGAASAQAPAVEAKKRRIFEGLDTGVIKDLFSKEELDELLKDETQVFTESERKLIAASKADKARAGSLPAEEAGPPEEEELYDSRAFSPIRRRRAYRVGLLGGLMYFGFVLCVSVVLCALGWMAANDVLSLSKEEVTASIFVGEDKNISMVAMELQSKGIINYKWLFELYGKISKASEKIDPGTYEVSSHLDYRAIVTSLQQDNGWSSAEKETVMVTIPEGKTLTQTFKILSDAGVCAYETLINCSQTYDFDYDFLDGVSGSVQYKLEGYLFPDTYEFYLDSKPEEAIKKFLNNFDAKVTDEMVLTAQNMGYTINEIITLASLIEMEAGNDAERPTIASVIYNRLNSNYYPYLQIDATIQYALEERKEALSYEDRLIDSFYNTYLYEGLPPGPIANPGLASIMAALNPESTGYYFYALNKEGTHNFFSDIDSFNRFLNSDKFGG
jgi:UPF0755 protein